MKYYVNSNLLKDEDDFVKQAIEEKFNVEPNVVNATAERQQKLNLMLSPDPVRLVHVLQSGGRRLQRDGWVGRSVGLYIKGMLIGAIKG
ncbi:hypothetical protein M6D81_21705 [Paenibacillus sp. J5C_2022]|uniref:hypothetical protein n=1 Tax=Paenibacillus sp. J5C2022 TaxID=2977129 RepID=UPI0021CE98CE|nr:hypothetical protein [Paenibacillus sp. J5C2022]MCU6711313.1 hypothetical protein [Paenibacillus sp. J5C2022]